MKTTSVVYKYICNKDYNKKCINQEYISINKGKQCLRINDLIYYKNTPICVINSQDAYKYFSRDDDGHGLQRGELVHFIIDALDNKNSEHHEDNWKRIWEDPFLKKYKRQEHEDVWIWNFNFYNAKIEDLEFIKKKIEV